MLNRQEVLDEAQKKIDLAYTNTPPEYHGFITLISQNKRLNPEDRTAKPVYVKVESPYIRVDGRVAMARDEHRELGRHLKIETEFVTVLDTPMCRAMIESELYGTATGSAKVLFDGRGVDATNPMENAETSAIGRALGFLGYGLLGGGIASAEEVEQAIQEQTPATKSTKIAEADPYDLPDKAEAPSDSQMKFLRGLLSQKGTLKGDSLPVVHAVYEHTPLTKAQASADIEELKESDKLTPKYFAAYLKILRENAKMSHDDVYGYIKKYFNAVKIKELTREQQDQLIGWLTIGNDTDSDWHQGLEYAASVVDGDIDLVEAWARRVFFEKSDDEMGQRILKMQLDDIKSDILTYQTMMEEKVAE